MLIWEFKHSSVLQLKWIYGGVGRSGLPMSLSCLYFQRIFSHKEVELEELSIHPFFHLLS